MNNERAKIVLAALLHDIGKFYQRADASLDNENNQLSEQSKKLAGYICPLNQHNRFGYQHVIWTNEFLEKYLPTNLGFKTNVFLEEKVREDNIYNLAVYHHKPNSKLQALIALADWWSSGIDRRKESTLELEDVEEGDTIQWGRKRYKKRPLNSIFNIVNQGKGNHGFPLSSLSIEREIFPNAIEKKEDGISESKYNEHWQNFIEEYQNIPTGDIDSYIESLIFLLKKYSWCIPASTNDMANTSLYQHLKTTASIADCLYQYYLKYETAFSWNETSKRLTLTDNHYPTLLFGVDISGIQKFIYSISRRQAAKSLKGRSYYLQLLVDAIIRRIINGLGVTQAHVLYSSGGNFYMLLPNVIETKDFLKKLKEHIEKELWEEHKGALSVNMAWIPFAYHPDQDNKVIIENHNGSNLGDLWKALADKITIQKQQKFASVISKPSFFSIQEDGGDVLNCSVSGIELTKKEAKYIDNQPELPVTKIAYQQTKIGTTLKDADYIIEYKGSTTPTYLQNRAKSQIKVLSIDYYLFDQSELIKNGADFRRQITSTDVSLIRSLNQSGIFLKAQIKGQQVSYGFQFYGGNKQALLPEKQAKTFEDLAKTDSNDTTYLGVLRMDIDGLGKIFIEGLPEPDRSFSSYATLSMLLDVFFSGYLNTIRGDEQFLIDGKPFNFRDNVNILYSGGDDVFAVGRWVEIIAFAEAIQKEFTAFTEREEITISGGIAIVRQKFPISKAALMAGEAEEAAKHFKFNTKDINSEADKNAITFLGQTVSWKEEFAKVKKLKNEFVELANKTDSRGFLHQLIRYKDLKDKGDLSYIWNAVYYFKRFSERYAKKMGDKIRLENSKEKYVIPQIEKLKTNLFSGQGNVNNLRYFDLVVLAARWAELETKFNQSNKL